MKQFDFTETWLNNVAASHSGSKLTTYHYRRRFNEFLSFIEASAQDLLKDYENMSEKAFKRKYSMMVKAWISELHKKDYAPNTVSGKIVPVLSFFKYNDLPLGFIATPRMRVVFHNRDITKEEILKILAISRPRERAFFTMMAQSGLRPVTLCGLKLKHLEPDFSEKRVPCKVTIPQELAKGKYQGYFTFVGEETLNALKAYFATRPNMTKDSPIFSGYGEESGTHRVVWVFTTKFREAVRALKQKGELDYEETRRKPSELRLYNLRKWFRKMAHQAGFELVQFWMGHVVKAGVDRHYRPRDIEFHRSLYKEKSMPFLRLETSTPSETEQTIMELRKQLSDKDREIADLQRRIDGLNGVKRLAEVFERSKSLDEAFQRFKRLKDKEFETG